MKVVPLSVDNVMTLKGNYRCGSNKAWASYRIPKQKAMLVLQLCKIPDGYTEEQMAELLKETKITLGGNLEKYTRIRH